MKQFKYIIVLLIASFLVIGCEDELDIEPEQSLSPEAAFANELATRASLNGAYSRLQDLDVFGSTPQIIGDFQADNVNFIGSFPTLQQIFLSSNTADNTTTRAIFRDNYRAILAANGVIQNTPNVDDPGFSTEERNEVIAEALFIRALTNFNLVILFGQPYTLDNGASPGISLTEVPDILNGNAPLIDRSSVAQVYEAIESDLLMAISNLPTANSRKRATVGAANGLLSRLYLYQGDFASAAERAQMVIQDDYYTLAPDYAFYNALTPETVFDIFNSATDNGRTGSGGWGSFYNPAERGGRGDCPYSEDLLSAFDQVNDKRFTELTQVGDNGLTYTTKFPDGMTYADNAPVLRTTEMYLNRAEGLVRSSGNVDQEAIDIINMLRERAGLAVYTAADFASVDEFVDALLVERRKELCFEGHRRMDLLRNNLPIVNGLMPGDDQVVMPIPVNEIDLGSSLPQNPGY